MKNVYDLALMNKCTLTMQWSMKSSYPDEEIWARAVAYEIQQAVEKLLKHILRIHNARTPKTHDIDTLITMIDNINLGSLVDINLRSHARDLTYWEASSRYMTKFSYNIGCLELLKDSTLDLFTVVEKHMDSIENH